MTAVATGALPQYRPDLLIRPLGEDGRYVVKDPLTGEYFHLGAEEHFLLTQLDGRRESDEIRAAFERQFGQALSDGGTGRVRGDGPRTGTPGR